MYFCLAKMWNPFHFAVYLSSYISAPLPPPESNAAVLPKKAYKIQALIKAEWNCNTICSQFLYNKLHVHSTKPTCF